MVLAMIFVQDIKSRSVYWLLFPLLVIGFLLQRISLQAIGDIWPSVLANTGFLGVQLLLVSAWFSMRNGRWTDITESMLGWGDILFLAAAAFGLSVFNFILFYITSLLLVIIYWILFCLVSRKPEGQIPLAGLQALLLAIAVGCDRWLLPLDLTNDQWILNMIMP